MKNILTLFRAEAYSSLNPRRMVESRSKNKGGAVNLLFGVFLVLLIIGSACFYAFTIGKALSDAGTPESLLFIFFAADALLTLITAASTGSARMFRATNMDALMSMPLTGFQIYTGKLMAFLAENYVYSAIILIPAFAAYAYYAAPSLMFILAAAALFLTVPMIPVGLGLLISALFSLFSFGGRSRTVRNFIGIALFVGFYLLLMSKSGDIMAYLIASGGGVIDAAGRYFPPLKWAMEGALLKWGPLLLFAAFAVALILLVAWLASLRFGRRVGALNASPKAKAGAVKTEAARSAFSALFRKEAAGYFSSFAYFMNTAFGPIMLVVGAVYMAATRSGAATNDAMREALAPIMMLVAVLATSTCSTAASSISIEGSRLGQLKAMPVRPRDVFAAKIALNILVCSVPALLAGVCLIAAGVVKPADGLIIIAGVLCFAVFTSVAGLLVNLRHPKLEWTNENAVVKQSASVGLTLGIGFVFSAICGAVFYLLTFKAEVGATVTLAALAGLAFVAALCASLLLKAKGEKLYNSL
ncbi:MAG: hypothetical protein IJU94_02345 [Clostridia bacterium]|nr:hypothetical protein [Clostridia bacterium]